MFPRFPLETSSSSAVSRKRRAVECTRLSVIASLLMAGGWTFPGFSSSSADDMRDRRARDFPVLSLSTESPMGRRNGRIYEDSRYVVADVRYCRLV